MDRSSYFSDDVIERIISFLPTKEVVKASILSRRWKNHWKSMTHLNFDDGYPNRHNSIIPTSEQGSFVNFVYRVLLSKSTTLDSFRLKCGEYLGWLSHAHYWICVAISRQVREIDVTILTYGIRLPPSPWSPLTLNDLFLSTNLVVLKLGRGFKLNVPDIISLPKLETLHLSSVEFEEDGESFTRLVSSCPLLVELKLDGTISKPRPEDEDGKVYRVDISSQVLKRLIMRGLYYKYYTVQIVLNTPLLEYLKHDDYGVPDSYYSSLIETLQFLDRASLSLPLKSAQYDLYSNDFVLSVSMEDLVLLVSHVRFLWLTKYTFEAFCHPILMAKFQLPIFSRLIDLRIGAIASNEGLNLLKDFLQASPQLTHVSFSVKVDPMQGVWNPPAGALPVCMQHNLSVVWVTSFTLKPLELNMVKFFLQHTTRLTKLILGDATKEFGRRELHALIDTIRAFPKASNSYEIVIT